MLPGASHNALHLTPLAQSKRSEPLQPHGAFHNFHTASTGWQHAFKARMLGENRSPSFVRSRCPAPLQVWHLIGGLLSAIFCA